MMPRINNEQAKEAALLFKDIILDYYRDPNNMATYIDWLRTQTTPECIAELKKLTANANVKNADVFIEGSAASVAGYKGA